MKYAVHRTSCRGGTEGVAPCEGAALEKCAYIDERTFKTPEEHDLRFPGTPWRSKGSNHRITPNGIARDLPNERWFMEIPDLLAFAEEHGELILTPACLSLTGFPNVEIYDDWRE